MRDKVVLGDCTLYLADMREVLPSLSPVDCIATDNPYKLTSGGKNTGKMKGIFDPLKYNNDGSICKCDIDWDDWLPYCYNVLKADSHAYFFANDKNLENLLIRPANVGFKRHTLLTWDKGNKIPNRWFMLENEYIGFFRKGKAFPINDCGYSQNIRVKNVKNKVHNTQKPVELMRKLVESSTKPGEVVLDPFAGSGSTAIACLQTGRKFIGVEIEEEHFKTMVSRIENYYNKVGVHYGR